MSAPHREAFLRAFLRAAALSVLSALTLCGLGSCDTFKGSVVAMSITWPVSTMTGMQVPLQSSQRLEMWARLGPAPGQGEFRRLIADVGAQEESLFTGFSVVYAVDPNDPCLIRGLDRTDEACEQVRDDSSMAAQVTCGAHLFGLRSHVTPVDNPLPDPLSDPAQRMSADLLRQQLVLQVRKVVTLSTPITATATPPDPAVMGRAQQPLLALVQHNLLYASDPRRDLMASLNATTADDPAASLQRLQACRQARDGVQGDSGKPANPYFYVGNPRQYTKPLAGFFFGVFSFATAPSAMDPTLPTQNLSGISFSVPFSLDQLQEILVLVESGAGTTNPADPLARKLMLMRRLPDAVAGRGAIKLVALANTDPMLLQPMFTVTIGTATVLTNLDSRLD